MSAITHLVHTLRRGAVPALILLSVSALAGPALAETRVGGALPGETRWTKAGSPYIATEDVVIPKGSKLVIEPGVTVRFKENIGDQTGTNKFDIELIVQGLLVAKGAEGDSIYFTSDAARPTWQDWQGIVVQGKDARAEIEACHIELCNEGIRVDGGSLSITGSTIQLCDQVGIHFVRATGVVDGVTLTRVGNFGGTGIGIWLDLASQVDIRNSFVVGVQNGVSYSRKSGGNLEYTVVSLCVGNGLIIRNSSPTVTRTSVSGNEYGVVISGGAAPTVTRNNFFNNGIADAWIREYRRDVVKIDLSNNYWGTTVLAEIEDQVLDAIDSSMEKGFAILEPFLTEAVITDSAHSEP